MICLQSFLAVEDIGDSLDAVEALTTKHNNFEKSLVAQEEKFKVSVSLAKLHNRTKLEQHL